MTPDKLKFGCPRAPEDPRDHLYKASAVSSSLAANIDLRPFCPPIRNQGDLGACTAFGATALVDFVRKKQGLTVWTPSPLFTYYSTRLMEGTVDSDSGAYVRDALKSTVNDGVALEREWPYLIDKFNVRPSEDVWANATKHQTLEYLKLNDTDKAAVLGCLNDGYPFIFGIRLYTSFTNSLDTMFGGSVHEPNRAKEKLLGGHCMMCVGYQKRDDESEYAIVMNSWGSGWGDAGYCYIPLNYLLSSDSYDFWTVRTVEVCDEDIADPVAPAPAPIPVPEPPAPEPEPVPPTPEPPAPIVPPAPPVPEPVPVVPIVPDVPSDIVDVQKQMDRNTVIAVLLFVIVLTLFFLIK